MTIAWRLACRFSGDETTGDVAAELASNIATVTMPIPSQVLLCQVVLCRIVSSGAFMADPIASPP